LQRSRSLSFEVLRHGGHWVGEAVRLAFPYLATAEINFQIRIRKNNYVSFIYNATAATQIAIGCDMMR